MRGLISSFKRYFIFGVLVLMLTFLLWLRFFVVPRVPQTLPANNPTITPKIPEVLQKIQKTEQVNTLIPGAKQTFVYNGPVILSPSELKLYNYKKMPVVDFESAKAIAAKYNFSEEPNSQDKNAQQAPFYLWLRDKEKLFIGGSFPTISYFNYSWLVNYDKPQGVVKSEVLAKTKKELEKLSLENIDYGFPVFVYYKTTVPDKETGAVVLSETEVSEDSSFVGVGLTYKINGYPFVSDAEKGMPIFLVFDPKGNLYSLRVFLFPSPEEITTIKTIPFDQAVKQLDNRAVIIYARSKTDINEESAPLYKLQNVTLSSARLVYYFPINYLETLAPYYVFNGTALDSNRNVSIDVVVLLPAGDF